MINCLIGALIQLQEKIASIDKVITVITVITVDLLMTRKIY